MSDLPENPSPLELWPLDALIGEIKRLRAENGMLLQELRIIAAADPSQWEEDMRDQFREWAQNRARATIAAAEKGKE